MLQNYAKTAALFRANLVFVIVFSIAFGIASHLVIPNHLTILAFLAVSAPLAFLLQCGQMMRLPLNGMLNPARLREMTGSFHGARRFLATYAILFALPALLLLWLASVDASAGAVLAILLIAAVTLVIELTVFGLMLPATTAQIDLSAKQAAKRSAEFRAQLAWELFAGAAIYLVAGAVMLFLLAVLLNDLLQHRFGQITFSALVALVGCGLVGLVIVTLATAWKRSEAAD